MLTKLCLAIVGGLMVLPQMARADSFTSVCVDASLPKLVIAARNGKWTELTPEQWQFLRGVYVNEPGNARGLALWRQGRARPSRQLPGWPGVLH